MEAQFWHKKWENNEIGFHEADINPVLLNHFSSLALPKGARVLVPLCGKSHDMEWLVSQGYDVVGIELSERAVQQFFEHLNVTADIEETSAFNIYRLDGFTIYQGDIFSLLQEDIGRIDAIYDRAALVALPEEMRKKYVMQLRHLCGNAPQLLITFTYDQTLRNGPPFSVSPEMVTGYYQDVFTCDVLAKGTFSLKGINAEEHVWHLYQKE